MAEASAAQYNTDFICTSVLNKFEPTRFFAVRMAVKG